MIVTCDIGHIPADRRRILDIHEHAAFIGRGKAAVIIGRGKVRLRDIPEEFLGILLEDDIDSDM